MAAGIQDCVDAGMDNCMPGFGTFLIGLFFGPIALLMWIVAATSAMFSLAKKEMPGSRRALWMTVIIVVPIVGASSWFIYRRFAPDV